MLEKNKDYIEMRVHSTDCGFTQNAENNMSIEGYTSGPYKFLPDPGETYIVISKDKFEALQTENEQIKKKLHEFDPIFERFLKYTYGGQVSVNGWEESAKFWKKRYDDILKLIGFSSTEEIQDYLTNEAECDTLHEAILKLIDENKYACEEWCKANSNNNSWKAAAECNSPKELIEKIKAFENEIGIYSRTLQEWKEGTGCPSPSAAKTLIESGMSWHHAYNEINKANEKLVDDVKSWRNVTGYSTPESCLSDRINNACKIQKWKEATGCDSPEEAKEARENKKRRINELNDELDVSQSALEEAHDRTTEMEDLCMEYRDQIRTLRQENKQSKKKYDQSIEIIGEWQRATGHFLPKAADEELASLKKEVSDYKEQVKSLYKVIESWNKVTCCSTPEDAKDWVNELGEANGSLAQAILSWQEVTGFKTPKEAKDYWTAKLSESGEVNESFAREVRSWHEITGFSTPEKCSSYIDTLEEKLEDIKNLIEED